MNASNSPEKITRQYRRTQAVNRLILGTVILIFGGLLTAGVDYLLGVSFEKTSVMVQAVHKVTYMAWGVVLWKLW